MSQTTDAKTVVGTIVLDGELRYIFRHSRYGFVILMGKPIEQSKPNRGYSLLSYYQKKRHQRYMEDSWGREGSILLSDIRQMFFRESRSLNYTRPFIKHYYDVY